MRIGIDFDNTLAGYDRLFLRVAKEWRLLPEDFAGGKREIRDAVRRLADGEATWTRLQAEVYGRRMSEAELLDGASDFLRRCREGGIEAVVVSHKTRHAAADPGGVDLHHASLTWMAANGFFEADGLGLAPGRVFFEATRHAKCERIAALNCSHFIDDLEEVFREPAFPEGVERLLLAQGEAPPPGPFTVYPNWQAIQDAIFAHGRVAEV